MKRSFLALTAVLVAFGCTEAPTSPELVPQFSMAPVEFTMPFEFPPTVNPCTGLEHTISGEFTAHEHIFGNSQNLHVNAQAQFDVTTSDGFSGSAVQHFTFNINEFNGTNVTNVNLSDDSGQRIKLHLLFHITVTDDDVLRVVVVEASERCVGKSVA